MAVPVLATALVGLSRARAQEPASPPSGYWLATRDGHVFAFGAARHLGNAPVGAAEAVDLEASPSGEGYWVIDDQGRVFAYGDARVWGDVESHRLAAGETVASLSATPSGAGYWVFTTKGRVLTFGNAVHFGDVSGTTLNGPVLDSVPTPSGRGYYLVASDGGIFAFGDARFAGSMGDKALNAPVQSLVPDPDGAGYWLVASDGGVFAFDAPFRGSMGGKPLNRPVTGMVAFGSGYLMVSEDGGIFNFSDRAFQGSLGSQPPRSSVVAVTALGGTGAPPAQGPSVEPPGIGASTPVAPPAQTPPASGIQPTPTPTARAETPPARGDADDPAIWVHPSDPTLSLVIGTDKEEGLAVYGLDGRELQFIDGIRPNNVDLRGDVVVAADDRRRALLVFRVDPTARRLVSLGKIPTGIAAHGLCLSLDRAGTLYAFPNSLSGHFEQWELVVTQESVTGRLVRTLDHGGAVEGCVADDRSGALYLGEEADGVWRYEIPPVGGVLTKERIDAVGTGRLVADVEGLTILRRTEGDVLLVSSQGDDHFAAYRLSDHRFITRFRVAASVIDGCEKTDGIDVSPSALGPAFPNGLFVCQDGEHKPGTNFKLAPLEAILAVIDAT